MKQHDMTLPNIETVAEQVHGMWMTEKIKNGITSRIAQETGEELMVPYAQLSEVAKEMDRAMVRMVYAAIIMAGNEVPNT